MDFQVRISEAALADFEDILEYSWATFPATAERFGKAILNHVDLLKSFPYVGSPVAGRAGVRQLGAYADPDLLPRSRKTNIVEILHFWHAARKIPPGEP